MSSSTDTFARLAHPPASQSPTLRRSRILRDAPTTAIAALEDLDAVHEAARRVVDPTAFAEALAEGFEEGRADGYARGLEEGRAVALQEGRREEAARTAAVQQVLDALQGAIADVAASHHQTIAQLEQQLVAGAFELAEAILGRELELATDPGRDAIARALRLAEPTEDVVARLHPDDIRTLGDHADLAPGRDLTVVADAAVGRGGCVLQAGDGQVDARLGSALARVRQVLAP